LLGAAHLLADVDGDGVRVVHCNSHEGAEAGLRTYLRVIRGVHKKYLAPYVAVYQVMTNAKQITGEIIRQMCYRLIPTRSKKLSEKVVTDALRYDFTYDTDKVFDRFNR